MKSSKQQEPINPYQNSIQQFTEQLMDLPNNTSGPKQSSELGEELKATSIDTSFANIEIKTYILP